MYWPENSYIKSKLTVRFSFLTLHLNLYSKKNKDRCTACLYGMVSRIIVLPKKTALMRCFPKASAKVVLFFIPANYYDNFFTKILNFFKHLLIFSDLQKRLFRAFFHPKNKKKEKPENSKCDKSKKNTLFAYSFFKKNG